MIVAHPQHILSTGGPSLGPQVRLLIRSFTLPRWRYTDEMTKTSSAGRALSAPAAGMGILMMGVLNQPGYSYMSDPSDLYRKFILELVPNNAYNDWWFCKDLRPVQPMHPRIGTVIVQSGTASMPRNASMSRTTMSGANFRTLGRYL